jgi:hypothetical protein
MGVWGPGNFDGDSPRDFLADMMGRWETLVEKLVAGETPEEAASSFQFDLRLDYYEGCLMPMVEVIIAVAERLHPDYLPTSETVERWRSAYLGVFDREISSWDAGSKFEAERRGVIEATFSRLLTVISSRSKGKSSAEPHAPPDRGGP